MNDHLFAMLMTLFEQTLMQIQQLRTSDKAEMNPTVKNEISEVLSILHAPSAIAIRVMTPIERSKLTKPALQFLLRLMHTGMLSSEQFEHVMNIVMDSSMRIVSVEEVKYIIHHFLLENMSHQELLMFQFAFDVETSSITMQ